MTPLTTVTDDTDEKCVVYHYSVIGNPSQARALQLVGRFPVDSCESVGELWGREAKFELFAGVE